MTSFRYKVVIVSVLVLAVASIWWIRHDIQAKYRYDKISLLARFTAKEFCSCRFVVKQSEAYCREYVNAYIPILGKKMYTKYVTSLTWQNSTETPPKQATVLSRAFHFVQALAQYTEENGCRLDP